MNEWHLKQLFVDGPAWGRTAKEFMQDNDDPVSSRAMDRCALIANDFVGRPTKDDFVKVLNWAAIGYRNCGDGAVKRFAAVTWSEANYRGRKMELAELCSDYPTRNYGNEDFVGDLFCHNSFSQDMPSVAKLTLIIAPNTHCKIKVRSELGAGIFNEIAASIDFEALSKTLPESCTVPGSILSKMLAGCYDWGTDSNFRALAKISGARNRQDALAQFLKSKSNKTGGKQ